MAAANSNLTPLLTAFRGSRLRASSRVSGERLATGPWFQSLITFVGCLLPISVCWYFTTGKPLFSIGTVEFIQPDLVAGAFVTIVIGRALFKGFHPLPRTILVPFLLLLAATLLSTFFAIDKLHGVAAIIQETEFVAFAWAFSLSTSTKSFLRIVHFTLALFVFQTAVAIWQFAFLDATMPTGTFQVHQQYAFFTSFAAAMAFALYSHEKASSLRVAYLVVLSVLLIGSLLGQERAPWLSFLLGATAVVWYSGRNRKRLLVGLVVTVLAATMLVITVPHLREVTTARIGEAETGTERQNSLLSRLLLWKVAYDLFTQNPVLGVGPKNFAVIIPHYASVEDMQGFENLDAHNVWIGMLAEQGVTGFVTYLIFCWAIIRLATSELRSPSVTGLPRSLCLAYVAYFFFWLGMMYPFFQKGAGHIDFMLVGLMLGLRQCLSQGRASVNLALTSAPE
ncbi:MAG: O-antigen polymerase [Acidobacteriaceae bacterium]|nr:O-antigen polymerase [Acidobacteriaceae bacterium]